MYSFLELSSSAFAYNIQSIKKASQGSSLALVLKSNAYGHGLQECAQFAKHNPDIAWICTSSISEALSVHAIIPEKPILVLSSFDKPLDQALIKNFHLTVHTLEDAYSINHAAQSVGIKASVHIKIDTGMSRLGVIPEEAPLFIEKVLSLPSLNLYGIFTHLCDTPNQNQAFSYNQLQQFDDLLATLESKGLSIPCTHALSSSGLALKPRRPYSLIRVGAFAYGIKKSKRHTQLVLQNHPHFDVEPVLQWKAPIISLKTLQKGDTVGYDRTFKAERTTKIAIVPIGYADGYPRSLSNKKEIALLKGQRVSVAGLVSMNLTAFDVTEVPHVSLGDMLLLLGGKMHLSLDRVAETAGIISNNLAVGLSPSLPRIIHHELFPLPLVYEQTESAPLRSRL